MTDMTDLRTPAPRRGTRPQRGEYLFYFGLILLFAVPIALVLWTVSALRGQVPDRGPLALALAQANDVAPKIFWA